MDLKKSKNSISGKNSGINSPEIKTKKKNIDNFYIIDSNEQDIDKFNDETFVNRKYCFNNVQYGIEFFKIRYIAKKTKEVMENFKKEINNTTKDLTLPITISDTEIQKLINFEKMSANSPYEKQKNHRKYLCQFLQIVEESIFSFNMKKFQDSYNVLFSYGLIKNKKEYGEFLLTVKGYDKKILGEFLSSSLEPNEDNEVLIGLLESVGMNNSIEILESVRFLFSRLILPSDKSLLPIICDRFAAYYYETNKNIQNFNNNFPDQFSISVLLYSIVDLNNEAKNENINDKKNKNEEAKKKNDFIMRNLHITGKIVEQIYNNVKKNKIKPAFEEVEEIYKKFSYLVKENDDEFDIKNINNIKTELAYNNIEQENQETKNEDVNLKNRLIKGMKSSIVEKIDEKKGEEQFYNDILYYGILENYDENNKEELEIMKKRKSFSLLNNLYDFSKSDQEILTMPNKFDIICGKDKPTSKEYIALDKFSKLAYNKVIDADTFKLKHNNYIEIKDIKKIYLGEKHKFNENIIKYLNAFPNEKKSRNIFITILVKDPLILRTKDIKQGLLWYKAMASLVLKTVNYNEKENIINKNNTEQEKNEEDITLIWKNHILGKLSTNYNEYLYTKWINERQIYILYFDKKLFQQFSDKNEIFEDKSNYCKKFLQDIKSKIKKEDNFLEHNEFFNLYQFGLPDIARKTVWPILITNRCQITDECYESLKNQFNEIIDFEELDQKYQEDVYTVFCQNQTVNQIIKDILKKRYLFIYKIKLMNFDQKNLLLHIYNIARCFFLYRPDIPYNKGIISLIYILLLIDDKQFDEKSCFRNLVNLVSSNVILKLYVGEKETKKSILDFFNEIFEEKAPILYNHFKLLHINTELFLFNWLEELFTRTLNTKILYNVIDLYLLYGDRVLYQVAITIIKLLEEDLLNLTVNEIFKYLKRIPEIYTVQNFFETFKSLDIKNKYYSWQYENHSKFY